VTPGSNAPFGGQTLALKAVPRATADAMLLREPVGMKMSMGATMGSGTAEMREWFTKGSEYLETRRLWEEGDRSGTEPRRDLQLEGLGMQLTGAVRTHTHAQRAIEMQYALRMAREFGLDLVLHHAFDGWKIADDIAAQDVSVCYGPIVHSFANENLRTPGILAEKGVTVALNMDSASDFQKYLLHAVQIAVRYGMDPMEGLRSVTVNPAEMLGLSDRVGSLAPGMDGDLVVLDGDPLSTFTNVLYTVVDGEVVYDRAVHGSVSAQVLP
jgi:imidazolonepropionase-like amidohydrolase